MWDESLGTSSLGRRKEDEKPLQETGRDREVARSRDQGAAWKLREEIASRGSRPTAENLKLRGAGGALESTIWQPGKR